MARAGNTNEVGMHLLGDYTTWNFINLGDPDGTLLKNKPTVKYGKNTSKSEQLNFAISYSRVFGKHDVSATAVVELLRVKEMNCCKCMEVLVCHTEEQVLRLER